MLTLPVLLYPGLLKTKLVCPLAKVIGLLDETVVEPAPHEPEVFDQPEKTTSEIENRLLLSPELNAQ